MPGIEHCDSPNQMPHLEPLGGSSSEPNSLHGPSTVTLSEIPSSGRPITPSAPSHKPERDIAELMRELTGPLQLSLVLENRGNVARDHLASERTYLAYVRTSLACASAGVALVQLFTLSASVSAAQRSGIDLTKFAKPLGATIILFALIILGMGLVRYFATQSALIRGHFPVARNSITAVAFVLGALVGIVFAIIVAGTQR